MGLRTTPKTAAERLREVLAEDGWAPGSLAMGYLDDALAEARTAALARLRTAVEGRYDLPLRTPTLTDPNAIPIEHDDGCANAYGNLTYPCRCLIERGWVLALIEAALANGGAEEGR